MHYSVGRVKPVLAAASSGVGERQEGVKKIGTMIVARFGKLRQSGKQAHAQQSARRHSERGDMQVGIMHTRGHHVNSALRPT